MDALAAEEIFSFEGFRLDRRAGGLLRADENGVLVPAAIGSRALDLLILLVRRHGDLVSRDEIMTAVWPGIIVEDSNLPTQISALRRALDRERSEGSCIQTVSGRGYRFVAAVTHLAAATPSAASPMDSGAEDGDDRAPVAVGAFAIDSRIPEPQGRIRGNSGNGINVAKPLEVQADPGGVARDRIGDRPPLPSEDSGGQTVKRIARPVRPESTADTPASSMPILTPHRRAITRMTIAAAVGAALAVAVSAWWLWPAIKPPPTPVMAAATSIAQPLAAPRMSIVVLPFASLSNDPDQQYFADGVTEDLTTDLSRIADLFVISRNTAFTYRNKPVNTKEIGRELGVHYVLEGSVRRSGGQVRVSAQLIDAATDTHLWAERFDRDIDDLFAMQDKITPRIANALKLELTDAEAARPTEHPDALDYILRARAVMNKPHSREIRSEQISLYERALALDPDSVEAQSGMAGALAGRILANMTDTVEADVLRAENLAARALAASPNRPLPHMAKANLLRAQRAFAEAIPEYETVLALDRNWVFAFFALGQCKLFTGSIEETIPLIERAIRLSPRDPELGVWYQDIGLVHLLQSRTVEAIIWLEKARNHTPAQSHIRAELASAYGLNGETERATAELAEARRLSGDDRYSSLARLRALGVYGAVVPKIQALFEATHFAGLRKAGVPEE